MKFDSAIDAEAFYKSILSVNKEKDEILNNAYAISKAKVLANDVNEIVKSSPYLTRDMKISLDSVQVFNIVDIDEVIENVKQYPSLLTKSFRNKFTESCIDSLTFPELSKLFSSGVIKSSNLDGIRRTGSELYEENFKSLCSLLGKESVVVKQLKTKVKGTTFPQVSGESRQDVLDYLSKLPNKGKGEVLNVVQETYTPEGEAPEPAYNLLWNGKSVGYLPKATALELAEVKEPLDISVSVLSIEGGKDGVPYGCMIEVEASALYTFAPPLLKTEISNSKEQ